jgi:hypothetical protein
MTCIWVILLIVILVIALYGVYSTTIGKKQTHDTPIASTPRSQQKQDVSFSSDLNDGFSDDFDNDLIAARTKKLAPDSSQARNIPKYTLEVVGTNHYAGESILRNLARDNGELWNVSGYSTHKIELTLVPEPDNKYDSDAIAVVSNHETPPRARVSRSGKIGYLPRGHGVKIEKETDVMASVKEGYGKFYVRVKTGKLK